MILGYPKKLQAWTLAIVCWSLVDTLYGGVVVGDTPIGGNPQVELGLPTSYHDETVTVSRKQYVLSWNYQLRVPEWVGWSLHRRLLGTTSRSEGFRLDRDLDEALVDLGLDSVGPTAYRGSCLERGHQVASADRTANEFDNQITFQMSNVVPQTKFLNRGSWSSLERFLRRQVLEQQESLQIYAGIIPGAPSDVIGVDRDIHVPSANFKVVVYKPRPRDGGDPARYFVVNFPNWTSTGTNPVLDNAQACWDGKYLAGQDEENRQAFWRPHLTRLRTVENQSGLRFDFLDGAQEMTAVEVDALIAIDRQTAVKSGFQFRLQDLLRLQSTP